MYLEWHLVGITLSGQRPTFSHFLVDWHLVFIELKKVDSSRWTILILHWTVLKSQDQSAYRRNKSGRTGQARAAWAGLAEKAGSKGLNLGRRVPMKTGQGEEGEGDSSPQGSKAWEARLWASHQGPAGMPQQMRQVSRRSSQRPEVRWRLRACDSYSYWWNNDPSPAALWLSSHAAFSPSL